MSTTSSSSDFKPSGMERGAKKDRESPKANPVAVRDLTIEERRREVAKLYTQYKSQQEIADILGVSQSTVSQDIAAVKEYWREEAAGEYDKRLAEELLRLATIEDEARRAWELSSTVFRARPKEGMVPVGRRAGDVSFLTEARKCVETRLRILGALAPKNKDKDGNGGNTTVNIFDLLLTVVQSSSQPKEISENVEVLLNSMRGNDPVEERLRQEREKLEQKARESD